MMKVKTLLNKLKLKENQNIRVLDIEVDYFLETISKKEVVEKCGRSSVVEFEYSRFGDCFVIFIGKLKN